MRKRTSRALENKLDFCALYFHFFVHRIYIYYFIRERGNKKKLDSVSRDRKKADFLIRNTSQSVRFSVAPNLNLFVDFLFCENLVFQAYLRASVVFNYLLGVGYWFELRILVKKNFLLLILRRRKLSNSQ